MAAVVPAAPFLALAALVAAAVLAPATAHAVPGNGTTGSWTVVGGTQSVSAMERAGDNVYLGGTFTGIARRAPRVAALDAQTGELLTGSTEIETIIPSDVTAVVARADGGAYVAGQMSGGRPRIVSLAPSGTVERAFRTDIENGQVNDLAIAGNGLIYAAGSFTRAGGRERLGLAAFNPGSGTVAPWNPPATNAAGQAATVSEIELTADAAYVAGDFTFIGTATRPRVAKIPLSGSAATAWNPQPNSPVTTIAVAGATVYLGGGFTQVGGQQRSGLAAVNDSNGTALVSWDPRPSGAPPADSIVVRGGTVYAAGSGGYAALDASSAARLSWNPVTQNVSAPILAVSDEAVYIGFNTNPFPTVGGQTRCGLASVDPSSAELRGFDPRLTKVGYAGPCDAQVEDVSLGGGRVWASGNFIAASLRPRNGLAAIDVARDALLPWAPLLDDSGAGVSDLALSPDGARVYVSGQFTGLNRVPRRNVAAVGASGAADTPADVAAWDPAPDRPVNTLAVSSSGQLVFLGGDFSKLGTTPRVRLASVNATNGAATAWAPAPNQRVNDLARAADGGVYVAGTFTSIGTTPVARAGAALLDPVSGEARAWDPRLSGGAVDSVTPSGDLVYLGGSFTAAAGAPRSGVAAVDNAGAVSPWAPLLGGSGALRVQRVTPAPDGTVYVLGNFTTAGGVAHARAAQLLPDGSATAWDPPGMQPGTIAPPVRFVGERVVVGGTMSRAGGRDQAGFGVFTPATPPSAGEPPLITYDGALEAGRNITCRPGSFAGAGPFTLSYQWLRGGAPIVGQTGTVYTTSQVDVSAELRCRETGFNAAGSAQQTSAPVTIAPVPPDLEAPPAVGGAAWVGGEALCSTGIWRNAPTGYAFEWLLDGAPLAGATGAGFRPAASQLGRGLACTVTASNSAGSRSATSAPVMIAPAPPTNLSPPSLSGTARVGAELACEAGAWAGASSFSYGWLRDGLLVPAASGQRFQLTSRDLGRALACRVSASGPGGVGSADSGAATVQALPRQPSLRIIPRDDPGAGGRRRLDLRKVSVQPDGSVRLTIAVPGAGLLSARASATLSGRSKGASRRLLVGSAKARPRRAGTVNLRMKPGRKARRALERAGRGGLKVGFVVRFEPRGGEAGRTDRASFRLRMKQAAKPSAFTGSSRLGYQLPGPPT